MVLTVTKLDQLSTMSAFSTRDELLAWRNNKPCFNSETQEARACVLSHSIFHAPPSCFKHLACLHSFIDLQHISRFSCDPQVRKQKAVYHTLNKLNIDVTSKVLIAEAWMPTFATQAVQEALRSSAAMSSTQVGHTHMRC